MTDDGHGLPSNDGCVPRLHNAWGPMPPSSHTGRRAPTTDSPQRASVLTGPQRPLGATATAIVISFSVAELRQEIAPPAEG